ncbi:LysR family transcriptional regulator [Litoribrevibacter albus]|uniref:LysR family transcriptional regulator n=1 Tax=Litoribrevibacter albus TaxID=1473156 RepID=A0AA37S6U2_9GAMM|nr:LysR family transcriptional regulator [Litoribrevibacter albus]GLQ30127.1 LysR family transcriptional regulator [Litoribrevibacter albus]
MNNLDYLRMFVISAETGSFSACARSLGKAQSAISQGIANLEIDLGCQLFDRSSHKPTLTEQGHRLLSHAKAVLMQSEELRTAASAMSKDQESNLILAIDDAIFSPAFEPIIQEFSQRFPATALELLSIASPDIAEIVQTGRADIGLMFCDFVFPKEVDLCFLGNLPFYAVVSPEHPLATLSSVTVSDLLPQRQILLKGVDGRELAQFAPLSAQLWWSNNFYMQSELVKQGMGWAYLPQHMAHAGIHRGDFTELKLSFDHKPWNPPIDRVMQKNRVAGPALLWLSEALKEVFD